MLLNLNNYLFIILATLLESEGLSDNKNELTELFLYKKKNNNNKTKKSK